MPSPGAAYDSQAIAQDLKHQLDQHKSDFSRAVSTPADTPMFTREASGALVDRNGRVVVEGPQKPAQQRIGG